MANRRFYQFRNSLEPQTVDLFARVTFGSSGAPTLDATKSRGIASISQSGTGAYTIVLSDIYNRLLQLEHRFVVSSGVPASPAMFVVSETVNSDGKINIKFCASSGTSGALVATNPASGEEVRLQFALKNSNA